MRDTTDKTSETSGLDMGHRLSDVQRDMSEGRFETFGHLMLDYEKLIYNIAYRYFNNPEDARDMAQEAIIKIFKSLPNLRDKSGSFKAWVCAVTANTCLDELRKRRKRITDALTPDIPSSLPRPEDSVLSKETATEILAALEQLTDEHRTLVILRDMNGLSYQELAEAANIPLNTVKSRLSRARAALRELLRPF